MNNKSAGVRPTPIIQSEPSTPNIDANIDRMVNKLLCLSNSVGVIEKKIDKIKPAISIAILKHKLEWKLKLPEWLTTRPKSLKKLLKKEYPNDSVL